MRESFANFFTCKKITDSLLCICERGKGPKDDPRVRVGSRKPERTRRAAESESSTEAARPRLRKAGGSEYIMPSREFPWVRHGAVECEP